MSRETNWIWLSLSGWSVAIVCMLCIYFLFMRQPASDSQQPVPAAVASPRQDAGYQERSGESSLAWKSMAFTHNATPEEEETSTVFYFKNVGPKPVSIQAVRGTVGCRTEDLAGKVFHPGEEGKIPVRVDYGNLVGQQIHTVNVQTDEPNIPPYALQLRVRIPELVTVAPRRVFWQAGEALTPKSVTVRFAQEHPGRVTDATATAAGMATEIRTVEEGKTYEIVLAPQQELSQGGQVSIRIETDLPIRRLQQQLVSARVFPLERVVRQDSRAGLAAPPNGPPITSPLSARTTVPVSEARVRMVPNSLTWQLFEAPESKTIRVFIDGESPVIVQSVAVSSSDFSAELSEVKPGQEYRVRVKPASTGRAAMEIVEVKFDRKVGPDKRQAMVVLAAVAEDAAGLLEAMDQP